MKIYLSNVIRNQSIINFGTAGHVAQGKSTVVKRITGKSTQAYKAEKERNITIKLGYANCKIFINKKSNKVYPFSEDVDIAHDPHDNTPLELLYHISFVDCPGHQEYISTMISGSFIMDHVLVIIAANEPIPQPQTNEHLIALEYSGMPKDHMSFLINKLDLIKPQKINRIRNTMETYLLDKFSISNPMSIPISAATGDNIDYVISHISQHVSEKIPEKIEKATLPLEMYIVRSYNVNKPNTNINDLKGAVLGGTILSGVLAEGDIVEIRPGIINMVKGEKVIQPLISKVTHLKSGKNDVDVAIPGGLIGVNLDLYAGLSSDDKLKGQVITHIGQGKPICDILKGRFRAVTDLSPNACRYLENLKIGSEITVIVNGIMISNGNVNDFKLKKSHKGSITIKLSRPVVMSLDSDSLVALQINGHLVAGLIVKEVKCSLPVHYPDYYQQFLDSYQEKKYEIINDLEHYHTDPLDFEQLSQNISFVGKSEKLRYYTPKINVVNLSTFISEIKPFISSLIPEDHINEELYANMCNLITNNLALTFPNSKPRFNSDGVLILTGRWKRQFESFMSTFINIILKCPSCRSEKSIITKNKKTNLITRDCMICNSTTYLEKLTF
jgi:translation initiation factor 2 subunit 3